MLLFRLERCLPSNDMNTPAVDEGVIFIRNSFSLRELDRKIKLGNQFERVVAPSAPQRLVSMNRHTILSTMALTRFCQ